jgi:hypothetical protein
LDSFLLGGRETIFQEVNIVGHALTICEESGETTAIQPAHSAIINLIIYNGLEAKRRAIQSNTLTYGNPLGYQFAHFSLRIGFVHATMTCAGQ